MTLLFQQDGSEVFRNASSAAHIPYHQAVLHGPRVFAVDKSADAPFTIVSADCVLPVHGLAFDEEPILGWKNGVSFTFQQDDEQIRHNPSASIVVSDFGPALNPAKAPPVKLTHLFRRHQLVLENSEDAVRKFFFFGRTDFNPPARRS